MYESPYFGAPVSITRIRVLAERPFHNVPTRIHTAEMTLKVLLMEFLTCLINADRLHVRTCTYYQIITTWITMELLDI